MGFQIEGGRQKGSCILLFGGRQMGPHISFEYKESPDGIPSWLKEIARRDLVFRYLKVARWDLVFSCWLKKESTDGIPNWLKEIARRDLVFRYLEVARWDLIFRLNKRNRQMGFQVD